MSSRLTGIADQHHPTLRVGLDSPVKQGTPGLSIADRRPAEVRLRARTGCVEARLGRQNFYLMCVLPALKPFGSAPPLNKQKLLALVTESEGPVDIVRSLLLSDDLLQREAVLAGEIEPDDADLAVLTYAQAEDKQPLPHFLAPEQELEHDVTGSPFAMDLIWRRYFRYMVKIARHTRSHFLSGWIEYEVGLRNAMAAARAAKLQLDPKPYLVSPELANPDASFDVELAEWSAEPNPLAALQALDKARWRWLIEQEQWYSFNDDEVAAFTAKLILLQRWHRISETTQQ